jgi:hypothetical protein
VSPPGGSPQKCLPLPSEASGTCVAALADPVATGQPCDPTGPIDPCASGAACVGPLNPPNADFMCVQLCRDPGVLNAGDCPPSLSCQLLAGANASGYCFAN